MEELAQKMDIYINIPSERFLLRPLVAAPVGGPVLGAARSADSAAAAAPCIDRHTSLWQAAAVTDSMSTNWRPQWMA